MRPPPLINILGKQWSVEMVDGLPKNDLGACETGFNILKISEKQGPESMADTLLHEMQHAIEAELELKFSEHQVRLNATAWLQVLRANPALIQYILDGEPSAK